MVAVVVAAAKPPQLVLGLPALKASSSLPIQKLW
jgi:hypothetical protein